MERDEVEKYCLSFAGAKAELQGDPSNILVYKVGDKKFAYFKTSAPERWRFSVRVSPERFLELTDQDGVKPARYMHRFHWITVVQVSSLPSEYLKGLIQWSYHKALSGLSRRDRAAIDACTTH